MLEDVCQEMKNYSNFEELIRQLDRLAARRRLFDNERYAAVRLMGLLTLFCYEEGGGGGTGQSQLTGRSRRLDLASSTDHTRGMYLLLIGRATATLGGHGRRTDASADRWDERGSGVRALQDRASGL